MPYSRAHATWVDGITIFDAATGETIEAGIAAATQLAEQLQASLDSLTAIQSSVDTSGGIVGPTVQTALQDLYDRVGALGESFAPVTIN